MSDLKKDESYKKKIQQGQELREIQARIERRNKKRNRRENIKGWIKKKIVAGLSLSLLISILTFVFVVNPASLNFFKAKFTSVSHNISLGENSDIPTNVPSGSYSVDISGDLFECVPDVFLLNGGYDFSDFETLDKTLYNTVLEYLAEIKGINKIRIEDFYDNDKVSFAEKLERITLNLENTNTENIEMLFEELIKQRKEICEELGSADSYWALAQDEQNYAKYLSDTYGSIHNDTWNKKCSELCINSIEHFIEAIKLGGGRCTIGDLYYRMALSYDVIALLNDANFITKMKAFCMGNTLYKISLSEGNDNIHGNEAYYNIGNNYDNLFLILYQNPEIIGSDCKEYCELRAVYYYHTFEQKVNDNISKEKVYNRLSQVYNNLYWLYYVLGDYDSSHKYDKEASRYKSLYNELVK